MQTKTVRRDFPGGTVVENLPMQSNEDPAQSKNKKKEVN